MKLESLSDQQLVDLYRQQKNQSSAKHNAQMAKKIMLNSLYGALSNRYFRWYDRRLGEAVTLSGQLAIRWIEKDINKYMNSLCGTKDVDYVVAIDTDSIHVCFDKLVQMNKPTSAVDFLDQFARTDVEPMIANSYQALADYMNAYEQAMHMKREAIADVSIWTSKKHYIQNVLDNEGVRYATPKMKIMGYEAVKASTPQFCRDVMKQSFSIMVANDNKQLIDYLQQVRQQYGQRTFEQIASPRSVNGLSNYSDSATIYKKATPFHVRGALLYNKMLVDKKLDKKYPKIYEGDKIKFCYLKMPNPLMENVIAVPDTLPTEFGLDSFVDYDLQFEKTLLGPIENITTAIGWHVKPTSSLEDFF